MAARITITLPTGATVTTSSGRQFIAIRPDRNGPYVAKRSDDPTVARKAAGYRGHVYDRRHRRFV